MKRCLSARGTPRITSSHQKAGGVHGPSSPSQLPKGANLARILSADLYNCENKFWLSEMTQLVQPCQSTRRKQIHCSIRKVRNQAFYYFLPSNRIQQNSQLTDQAVSQIEVGNRITVITQKRPWDSSALMFSFCCPEREGSLPEAAQSWHSSSRRG